LANEASIHQGRSHGISRAWPNSTVYPWRGLSGSDGPRGCRTGLGDIVVAACWWIATENARECVLSPLPPCG